MNRYRKPVRGFIGQEFTDSGHATLERELLTRNQYETYPELKENSGLVQNLYRPQNS
ncbi:MAG: hypothetical protein V4543_10395 [Bacteroidota bacterium]